MKRLFFLLGVYLCTSVSAEVVIHVQNSRYVFPQAIKVSSVLASLPYEQAPFWPSAALFRVIHEPSEMQHFVESSAQLRLREKTSSDVYKALTELEAEVAQWSIHERIPVTIDYDLARLVSGKNPTITPGEYILSLPQRPAHVYVYGAVQNQGGLAVTEGMSLAHFVRLAQPLAAADRDFLYVIDPRGEVKKVGIAYWNAKPLSLAPGSQVLIPFRSNWWTTDYDQYHQSLLRLAANRVIE